MLTRKQHELLMFIHERIRESGVSPSFDEMKDALGLKSKSGIHRLITALEERGFIKRLAHRARALEILRLPDDTLSGRGAIVRERSKGFSPSVIEGSLGRQVEVPESAEMGDQAVEVPVLGRIAAGCLFSLTNVRSSPAAASSPGPSGRALRGVQVSRSTSPSQRQLHARNALRQG